MPNAPLRICLHPGCRTLVPRGYCEAHAPLHNSRRAYDETRRKEDPVLAENARIRSTSTWKKVAALHRAQNPLCCDPFDDHCGFPVPIQQSHHIIPLSQRPDLAFDMENLAPLCTRCHARVEAMERAGRPTQHLFAQQTNANREVRPAIG